MTLTAFHAGYALLAECIVWMAGGPAGVASRIRTADIPRPLAN